MRLIIFLCLTLLLSGCSDNKNKSLVHPDEVLKAYTTAITNQDYKTLVSLYGGSYEWISGFTNESQREDKEKIFENYLKVIPEKIFLNEIIEKQVINEEELRYTITYKKSDGTLFDVGSSASRSSKFNYTIKRINGNYKVMEPPPYQA